MQFFISQSIMRMSVIFHQRLQCNENNLRGKHWIFNCTVILKRNFSLTSDTELEPIFNASAERALALRSATLSGSSHSTLCICMPKQASRRRSLIHWGGPYFATIPKHSFNHRLGNVVPPFDSRNREKY